MRACIDCVNVRVIILLCLACLLGGCDVPSAQGPANTLGVDFSLPKDAPRKGAIIFLVDGVNGRLMDEMLAKGELPAIKKYFVDRGLYTPAAIASAPSITLVNLTSIVTGRFPGHDGIIGNNWFDRNELIWRNYETIAQKNTLDNDYRAPNIYEQFPNDLTFSLFYQPHRGCTKWYEDWTSAGPAFFFQDYDYVDRLTLSRFSEAMAIARKYNRFPMVTTVYLLSTDFNAYEFGIEGPQYREAIIQADRKIGRLLGDIERAGYLNNLTIALVSDHGMMQVDKHLNLKNYLRQEIGLKVETNEWYENQPFEERLKDYDKYSTVLYGSGDRYWAICLRKPIRDAAGKAVGFEPWIIRPTQGDLHNYPAIKSGHAPNWLLWVYWTMIGAKSYDIDLLDRLARIEAIDVIACRTCDNSVRVVRRDGEVEFSQPDGPGGMISYKVIKGGDPLGYTGKVPADALSCNPMTPRQWLEATYHTDYPDLPAQLLAYFRDPKSGDIAAFAMPGWDFGGPNHAGHGGLRPLDMQPPMMIAGPGVPHGRIEGPVRTVDLMPTILQLLGKEPPAGLDGKSFIPKAK